MDIGELMKREGIYYPKFSEVPFTGKITGKQQGSIKNGQKEGAWISYRENGQLFFKENYKDGKEEGAWVGYNEDGTVFKPYTGTYKGGEKISD